MAPAQLELFKFSLYVFLPVYAMLHYGDPEWYEKWVGPLRSGFRRDDAKQMEPPRDTSELKAELDRLRHDRLAKRALRDSGAIPPSDSPLVGPGAAAAPPAPPSSILSTTSTSFFSSAATDSADDRRQV